MAAENAKRVGVLAFDGVTAFDITGACEILAEARATDNLGNSEQCYETLIVGVTGKTVTSETGVVFKTHRTLSNAPPFDTIIVPGGRGLREPETNRIVSAWLAKQAPVTRRFVSICTGIYGLAPSGLLNERNVTTHWRFAHDVARRFPQLHMNYTATFLKDERFYSCAGNVAGFEMMLALIEEDFGPELALAVSREFAMEVRRPGGEENEFHPFTCQAGPADRLADLPCWILSHLNHNLSVETLAGRAGLCPRHFSRIFKRFFRTTPADFVDQLRLNEARRRLLIPRYTVQTVAESVGFKSCDTFRRAFERRFGINPSGYRNRFVFRARSMNQRPGATRPAIVSTRKLLPNWNN
jgi:transcriptional regulator GlxA family with amidase domain